MTDDEAVISPDRPVQAGSVAESAALRLAKYLKEFVRLRLTTVRDVSKYESVHWFGTFPQERECWSGAWSDDRSEENSWLEVKRPHFERMPALPDLLLPWVDLQALNQAAKEFPPLRSSTLLPEGEIDSESGMPSMILVDLSERPKVQSAYDRYRPSWEAWAEEHRRREAIQKVYADLFNLHTQVRKQGEIVEVVLGLGLVHWTATVDGNTHLINRHALVADVEIEFEPAKGIIRVVPPGDGARLRIEDDMLDASLRPDSATYQVAKENLDEAGDYIWSPFVKNALKGWSGALDAKLHWSDDLKLPEDRPNNLVVAFAPALILRKRNQPGMVRIYNELIENLSEDDCDVPEGWVGLVEDIEDTEPDRDEESGSGLKPNQKDPEIYFPLPANREQRRIVEAIEHRRGVLVQGPPGTGKSHTIANLICHLLASGKRILITAETSRALQVLKAKIPAEIQPLCVSLMGQGGDAFTELNKAVQGITTHQSSFSSVNNETRIAEIDQELDSARRRQSEIDRELRGLREGEAYTHTIGGYSGTASAIAKRVAQERTRYSWLPLPQDSDVEPSLSNSDLIEWLSIRRKYSGLQITEAKLQIPVERELMNPKEFAAATTKENEAAKAVSKLSEWGSHPAFKPILSQTSEVRDEIRIGLRAIGQLRRALGPMPDEWQRAAVSDLAAMRPATWQALLELTRSCLGDIARTTEIINDSEIVIPEGINPRKLREDAQRAMSSLLNGRKWKRFGVFTPKELRDCLYLQEIVIDGEPASTVEKLKVLCSHLNLEFALGDLDRAWRHLIGGPGGQDNRLKIALFRERSTFLNSCIQFSSVCQALAKKMAFASPPIPAPVWDEDQTQTWLAVIDAATAEDELTNASLEIDGASKALTEVRKLHDAHPIVQIMSQCVSARDVGGYSQCFEALVAIHQTRDDHNRAQSIESLLSKSVPALVGMVTATLDESSWDERFRDWASAWHWTVADWWLKKRADIGYHQGLWKTRNELDDKIRALLAEAAALRAWGHFFARLSARQTAALKSWRQAVIDLGKGTGRSSKASRLRKDARRHMDACRDSIPVWIMPRYLVAEMVQAAPGRYDLVIVDEASQLGIESLFLFYIAKKMIVVGDDQQISPYGIGINNNAIDALQRQFLDGFVHNNALFPQSSLYANAKIRFTQNIVLREHFRCMPEIIQFSNDLCYASNGTPLDPLRAYPANRLQPLVLRHVKDGYRVGGPQSAQNPPEADSVVAQVVACVNDPRYAGKTMGVISLQGEAQAKLIEQKLLAALDPSEIEARRLICGDAYAFQGDERSIVFLSMVAAPGDYRIGALTDDSARQRFNVAASRAQDQLWLFHTAELDALSPNCMRYRLLKYMLDPRRETKENSHKFDSDFERDVCEIITSRGYHVRTQVCIGDTNHRYRIDLVVEGMQGRLAVECDGDQWHGPDQYEYDMARQRDLERAGWQFVRIRGGDFYRDRMQALEPLWAELDRLGIKAGGIDEAAAEPPPPSDLNSGFDLQFRRDKDAHRQFLQNGSSGSANVELDLNDSEPVESEPRVAIRPQDAPQRPKPQFRFRGRPDVLSPRPSFNAEAIAKPYNSFEGNAGPDPRSCKPAQVARGLLSIIEVEGPMVAKRAYDVYLRGCEVGRMGGPLQRTMNQALQLAISSRRVLKENEMGIGGNIFSTVRLAGVPHVIVREKGPRQLEVIPPSELQLALKRMARNGNLEADSEENFRATIEFFGFERLTAKAVTTLRDALKRQLPYVDAMLASEPS
jgi:very-short-patch-repair endonuclease